MDKIKHDDIHERTVKLSAALKQVIRQTGQYAGRQCQTKVNIFFNVLHFDPTKFSLLSE